MANFVGQLVNSADSTPPLAAELIDQALLEMRWRCLSLAADMDRLDRARQSGANINSHPRWIALQKALAVLVDSESADDGQSRAQRVQMIFSDVTPPPKYK